MDARTLYPEGHHPVSTEYSPDGIFDARPLSRSSCNVRYYFIDFGLSTLFEEGEPPLVLGRTGRDKEIPELSNEVPYDAYRADVFALGNLYYKEFISVRSLFPRSPVFPLDVLAEIPWSRPHPTSSQYDEVERSCSAADCRRCVPHLRINLQPHRGDALTLETAFARGIRTRTSRLRHRRCCSRRNLPTTSSHVIASGSGKQP